MRSWGFPECYSRCGNCTVSATQSGIRIPAVSIDFSVLQMSKPTLGPAQPPFRRPVGDGVNSSPFNPEFKSECSYTTVCLISLYGVDRNVFKFCVISCMF